MDLSKSGKRILLLFAAAFIGSGVFHVLLYDATDYPNLFWFNHFSQTYISVLAIFWMGSLDRHITDRRQRRLLLGISFFLILLFLLQISKYRLFSASADFIRRLWYAYYIPQTAVPVLLLCEAFAVQRPQDVPLPRICRGAGALGILLSAAFLTNDIHQQAFRFPGPVMSDERYGYGPVFYAFYAFFAVLLASSFAILLRKSSRVEQGPARFLPIVPLALLFLLSALEMAGREPQLFGMRLWNVGDVFAFAIAAFIEICIQTGLVPSNRDYEKLFRLIPLNAAITDAQGRTVFSSESAQAYPVTEGVKRCSHAVPGGYVQWETDLSGLMEKERELVELNEQLRSREDHLKQQSSILEEQSRLKVQNALYDRISAAVRPQLEKMDALLSAPPDPGEPLCAQLALLTAYIKRRSNMELSVEDGRLSSDELVAAVFESMENVKLCGVSAACTASGSGSYPASWITGTYEFAESVLEDSLDALESVMVSVGSGRQGLNLRMMLKGKSLSFEPRAGVPQDGSFLPRLTVSKEQDELIVSLTAGKRGGS